MNGSDDACIERATTASDRFLHVERSRALRDAPPSVAAALAVAFPR